MQVEGEVEGEMSRKLDHPTRKLSLDADDLKMFDPLFEDSNPTRPIKFRKERVKSYDVDVAYKKGRFSISRSYHTENEKDILYTEKPRRASKFEIQVDFSASGDEKKENYSKLAPKEQLLNLFE